MSGPQKGVLFVLASYADGETGGNAFPGVEKIAANACVDEKTVRRALNVLTGLGLIHHVGDRANSNGRPTKVWKLDLAALEATAANPSTQPDDAIGDHYDPGSSETGQTDHRNRAASPTELGGEPADLPMTSPGNSDAADAAPPFAALENPRLNSDDLALLEEAETFLRWVTAADRHGGNVERLVDAIAPYHFNASRWLAESLASKADGDARSGFLRSLWWEHVVERTEADDWAEFLSHVLEAEFDKDEAEELWEALTTKGARHPGLLIRSAGVDEVNRMMERHVYGLR